MSRKPDTMADAHKTTMMATVSFDEQSELRKRIFMWSKNDVSYKL